MKRPWKVEQQVCVWYCGRASHCRQHGEPGRPLWYGLDTDTTLRAWPVAPRGTWRLQVSAGRAADRSMLSLAVIWKLSHHFSCPCCATYKRSVKHSRKLRAAQSNRHNYKPLYWGGAAAALIFPVVHVNYSYGLRTHLEYFIERINAASLNHIALLNCQKRLYVHKLGDVWISNFLSCSFNIKSILLDSRFNFPSLLSEAVPLFVKGQ